ncbi:unnamed protein product [Dracunculus medinensis]|uniref:Uncharacterized protein n=1 Tax=Dracunculus medinensis TaxID=318479 RepID=A0A0N4UIZ2_DRAME|nr:unnamed protein product [Dracunculus medinensis]
MNADVNDRQKINGEQFRGQQHQFIGYQGSSSSSSFSSSVVLTKSTVCTEGGGINIRPRPQIPPKPQMDAVRYSMANVQESCDWELDTLLNELSALECQLNSSTGVDQLILGLPILPVPKENSTTHNSCNSSNNKDNSVNQLHDSSKRFMSKENTMRPIVTSISDCPSPDHDSAFGDSSSTESRNRRCRNSAISSSDSCRGSLNTPSPTQQVFIFHYLSVNCFLK